MRRESFLAITISLSIFAIGDTTLAADTVPVTPDNFVRAESDLYFGAIAVKDKALGRFQHNRGFEPLDDQKVIRANRDTLYSVAVFDLEAGPVTLTMPDAGDRFMSLQIFDEDQYTLAVHYGQGTYTLDKANVPTRYVMTAVRTLVDPTNEDDLKKGQALQDEIRVDQKSVGSFDVPRWDPVSQAKVRAALLELASTLPDTKGMFGSKAQVDPVRRLIGAASAWGGNPEKEALYLNVTPPKNDGKTVYKLKVKDVPVDGFWSISLYNSKGYYEENQYGAYTLNNLTAKKNSDGSTSVQFGGCDGKIPNCLPVPANWNYMVRLYRPHPDILTGAWKFPDVRPD